MQTQFTPNNKLASLGTVGLLFLAGIAGMVFLLPLNSAHAAGPTVTLSATSGTVGSFVTITGSGFTPGADVAIEFGTTLINTFGNSAGYPTVASELDTSGAALAAPAPLGLTCGTGSGTLSTTGPCIKTDANGWFSAIIAVPPVVNGAQTVTVADGTVTGTTTFTVNTNILISSSATSVSALTSGLPDEVVGSVKIVATGFAASDAVAFTASAFGGPGGAITTPIATTPAAGTVATTPTPYAAVGVSRSGVLYLTGPGVAVSPTSSLTVSDVLGGKLNILGSGTSSITATTSFTINPVIALYSNGASATTFTMNGSPNQALFLEGYGFTAGTVATNTITVAGSTMNHAAVTIGSTGALGVGGGNHLLLTSGSGGLTQGPASIVIRDGANNYTFNFASHNIVMSTNNGAHATDSAGNGVPLTWSIPGYTTETSVTGPILWGYGSPFIVSTAGIAGTVAAATLDSSAYSPNKSSFVTVFGSGFAASDNTIGVSSITPTGGTTLTSTKGSVTGGTDTSGAIVATANGAFWDVLSGAGGSTSCTGENTLATTPVHTGCLGEEPYPTTTTSSTYAITVTGATVAAVQSPTLAITPWISFSSTSSSTSKTISFGSTWPGVTFHGFTPSDTCTLAVGTTAVVISGTCAIGSMGVLSISSGGYTTPDLAGGAATLTGSDGVVTGTASLFVLPTSIFAGGLTSLSSNAGAAGSTTILRTGSGVTGYGIHGLAASTSYTLVWDPTETTQATLGTFTSTANGNIPAPGVQFTIPTGASGLHIVGLQTSTATNIFWNAIAASTISSTATETVGPSNSPDASNNFAGSLVTGQYGDNVFNLGASLTATPTVAGVGGSVAITGSGLPAATTFELGMSMAGTDSSSVPSTCSLTGAGNASPPTVVLGAFTSTSSGNVPASTSVAITDTPTYTGLEQGTLYCVFAQTATAFGGSTFTGIAQFELQASAVLNMTTAPSGHNVLLTAHGLNANKGYNIVFAPIFSTSNTIFGTPVGAILSNSNGAGSATFTVPASVQTTTGSQAVVAGTAYQVELQAVGSSSAALSIPPNLTVGGTQGTCTNQGTTCMAVSGTPSVQTVGAYKAIVASYTNNSNAPQTAVVYAVVHNAAGQTVLISTSTISPAAGASAQAQLILFGLPSGSYTATLFVTSTGGTAISGTTTVSVTL